MLVSAKLEVPPGLVTFLKAALKCLKAMRTEIGCSLALLNGEIFDFDFE